MKISTVVVAASLGQASATFFHNAPSFNCPGNSNNHCLDSYRSGLNWQDLAPGTFDKYKGFKWKGFQAVDKFSKRSELNRRNFQDKAIAGKAYKSRDQSPQMSCDAAAGNEKTSIKEFQIETAFDCDLEFHYGMPDGSVCKSRHRCEKTGTTVPNNQCGGATDVTIVYPHQPQIPHDGCDFAIPSIGFDCDNNTPSSTPVVKPPKPTTTPGNTYPAGTPPASTTAQTTSSTSPAQSTPVNSVPSDTYSASVPTTLSTRTSSGPSSASSDTYSASVPATTSSSVVGTTASSSVPGNTYPVIVPSGTSSVPVGTPSSSSSVPAGTPSGSSSVPVGTPSSTESVPTGGATTSSSSTPQTTYSGSVPSQSVPGQSSSATQPASSTESVPASTESVPASTESVPATYPAQGPSSTVTKPGNTNPAPAPPQETLPCPGVVPSCLNTWMFVVNCIDNTDSACYCPDEKFVKNVFECMYAHGKTDDIIQEAVQYFQGICAPYVPQNPAIGTGASTITQILTPTATAPPVQTYTTIEVIATTVVPCTDAQGSVIPSSSSTVTISQTISVPEVHFSTITDVPGTTAVGIVPGPTAYPTATVPQGNPSTGTTYGPYPTGGAGQTTTMVTTRPGGTGGATIPTAQPSIPVAGASRFGAGMGIAGMVAVVALVL